MYREATHLLLRIKKIQLLTLFFKKTLNNALDRAHPLNGHIIKASARHLRSSLALRDINGQHVTSLTITLCSLDRIF